MNLKEHDSVKEIHFSPRKNPFIKIETEIGKWNDYSRIVELSNLCRKLIARGENDVG